MEWLYWLFVAIGVLGAVAVFLYNTKNEEKKLELYLKMAAYIAAVVIISIPIMWLLLVKVQNREFGVYGISSYLLYIIFFSVSAFDKKIQKLFLPSFLILLVFARIGCQIRGCCESRFFPGMSIIESFLMLLFFILVIIKPKRNFVNIFTVFYSAFRLIVDFLKHSYLTEKLSFIEITSLQAVCVIVLIYFLIVYGGRLIKFNKKNNKNAPKE